MESKAGLRSLGLLTGFGVVIVPFLVLSPGSVLERSSVSVAVVALLGAISATKLSSLPRSEFGRNLLVGVGVGLFFVFGMTAWGLLLAFLNGGGA